MGKIYFLRATIVSNLTSFRHTNTKSLTLTFVYNGGKVEGAMETHYLCIKKTIWDYLKHSVIQYDGVPCYIEISSVHLRLKK